MLHRSQSGYLFRKVFATTASGGGGDAAAASLLTTTAFRSYSSATSSGGGGVGGGKPPTPIAEEEDGNVTATATAATSAVTSAVQSIGSTPLASTHATPTKGAGGRGVVVGAVYSEGEPWAAPPPANTQAASSLTGGEGVSNNSKGSTSRRMRGVRRRTGPPTTSSSSSSFQPTSASAFASVPSAAMDQTPEAYALGCLRQRQRYASSGHDGHEDAFDEVEEKRIGAISVQHQPIAPPSLPSNAPSSAAATSVSTRLSHLSPTATTTQKGKDEEEERTRETNSDYYYYHRRRNEQPTNTLHTSEFGIGSPLRVFCYSDLIPNAPSSPTPYLTTSKRSEQHEHAGDGEAGSSPSPSSPLPRRGTEGVAEGNKHTSTSTTTTNEGRSKSGLSGISASTASSTSTSASSSSSQSPILTRLRKALLQGDAYYRERRRVQREQQRSGRQKSLFGEDGAMNNNANGFQIGGAHTDGTAQQGGDSARRNLSQVIDAVAKEAVPTTTPSFSEEGRAVAAASSVWQRFSSLMPFPQQTHAVTSNAHGPTSRTQRALEHKAPSLSSSSFLTFPSAIRELLFGGSGGSASTPTQRLFYLDKVVGTQFISSRGGVLKYAGGGEGGEGEEDSILNAHEALILQLVDELLMLAAEPQLSMAGEALEPSSPSSSANTVIDSSKASSSSDTPTPLTNTYTDLRPCVQESLMQLAVHAERHYNEGPQEAASSSASSSVSWVVYGRVLCALATVAATEGQYQLALKVLEEEAIPLFERHGASRRLRLEEDEEEDEGRVGRGEGGNALNNTNHFSGTAHLYNLMGWCAAAWGNAADADAFFKEALSAAKAINDYHNHHATTAHDKHGKKKKKGSANSGSKALDIGEGFKIITEGHRAGSLTRADDGIAAASVSASSSFSPSTASRLPTAGYQFTGGLPALSSPSSSSFTVAIPLDYGNIVMSYAAYLYNSRRYSDAIGVLKPFLLQSHSEEEGMGGGGGAARRHDALLLLARCQRRAQPSHVSSSASSSSSLIEEALSALEEAERLEASEAVIASRGLLLEEVMRNRVGPMLEAALAKVGSGDVDANVAAFADAMVDALIAMEDSIAAMHSPSSSSSLSCSPLPHPIADSDTSSLSGSSSSADPFASAAYEQALVYHYDYVIPTASHTSRQPAIALGKRAVACYDRATGKLRAHIACEQRVVRVLERAKAMLLTVMEVTEESAIATMVRGRSGSSSSADDAEGENSDHNMRMLLRRQQQRALTVVANALFATSERLKDAYLAYAHILFDAGLLHEGLLGGSAASLAPHYGPQLAGGIYLECLRALDAANAHHLSAAVRLCYARSLLAIADVHTAQQEYAEALAIAMGGVANVVTLQRGEEKEEEDTAASKKFFSSTAASASASPSSSSAAKSVRKIVLDKDYSVTAQLAPNRTRTFLSAGEVHAHIGHFYAYHVQSGGSDETHTALALLAERHFLQAIDSSGIDVDAITYEGVLRLNSSSSTQKKKETAIRNDGDDDHDGDGVAARDPYSAAGAARIAPSLSYSYAPISPFPMSLECIQWALEGYALMLMALPKEFSLASKMLRTAIIIGEGQHRVVPSSSTASSSPAHRSSSISSSSPFSSSPHSCVTAYTALAGCMEHLATHGLTIEDSIGVLKALMRVPSAYLDVNQKYELVRRCAVASATAGDYATAASMFEAAIGLVNTSPELYIQYAQCLARLSPNTSGEASLPSLPSSSSSMEHITLQYELALASLSLHETIRAKREEALARVERDPHSGVCGSGPMSISIMKKDVFGNDDENEEEKTSADAVQKAKEKMVFLQVLALLPPSQADNANGPNTTTAAGDSEARRSPSPMSPSVNVEVKSKRVPSAIEEAFSSHSCKSIIYFDDHLYDVNQFVHTYDPFYVYSETALFLQTVKFDTKAAEALYKRAITTFDSSRTNTANFAQTLVNYALLKHQFTEDYEGARQLFRAAIRVDPTRQESRLSYAEFLYKQQRYGESLQQVLAILEPHSSLVPKEEEGVAGAGRHSATDMSIAAATQQSLKQTLLSKDKKTTQSDGGGDAVSSSSLSSSSSSSSQPINTQRIFKAVSRASSSKVMSANGTLSAIESSPRFHSLVGALKSSLSPDEVESVTESFVLALGGAVRGGGGEGEEGAANRGTESRTRFVIPIGGSEASSSSSSAPSSTDCTAAQHQTQGSSQTTTSSVIAAAPISPTMESMLECLQNANPLHADVAVSYLGYLSHRTMHYSTARACYKVLLERLPNDVNVLVSAAQFYGDVLKEKKTAKQLYLNAMRIEPDNLSIITSFAYFVMHAYPNRLEAEGLFKHAMDVAARSLAARGLEASADGSTMSSTSASLSASGGTLIDTELSGFGSSSNGGSSVVNGDEKPLLDLGVTLHYISFLADHRWSPAAAFNLFSKALVCFPKNAQLHSAYGAFLERYALIKGKKHEGYAVLRQTARSHYLKALQLSPQQVVPCIVYATSLSRQRKFSEAVALLQRAAQMEPSNETVLESCANVLYSWYSYLVSHHQQQSGGGGGGAISSGGGAAGDAARSDGGIFGDDTSLPPSTPSTKSLVANLFEPSSGQDDDGGDAALSGGVGYLPTATMDDVMKAAIFYYRRLIAINPLNLNYLNNYARFIGEGLGNTAVAKELYDSIALVEKNKNRARRESSVMMPVAVEAGNIRFVSTASTASSDTTAGGNKEGPASADSAVNLSVVDADAKPLVEKKDKDSDYASSSPSHQNTNTTPIIMSQAERIAQLIAEHEAKVNEEKQQQRLLEKKKEEEGEEEEEGEKGCEGACEDAEADSPAAASEDPPIASPPSTLSFSSASPLPPPPSSSPPLKEEPPLKGRPSTIEEVMAAVRAAEEAKRLRLEAEEKAQREQEKEEEEEREEAAAAEDSIDAKDGEEEQKETADSVTNENNADVAVENEGNAGFAIDSTSKDANQLGSSVKEN